MYIYIYIYTHIYIYIHMSIEDIGDGGVKPMEVVKETSALTMLIIDKPTKVLQRH